MAESHKEFREQGHKDAAQRLKERGGHSDGGHMSHSDMEQDKREIDHEVRKAFGQHDSQLHGGKKTRLKLKSGGSVEGESTHKRLDRASGGRAAHKGKSHTSVNVIVAPQGGAGAGAPGAPPGMPPHPPMMPPPGAGGPPGMPPGMGGPPGAMPPRPPMPPPGGMPPGAPPMLPGHKHGGRLARKDGGKAEKDAGDYDAGAAGGLGRMEKAKEYGKNADDMAPNGRKRGGKCD